MSDILYDEKGKVIGPKTIDTGVDQQGNQMEETFKKVHRLKQGDHLR